ncbi:hypothetical protein [Achromobacter marplatensis]|jgi:hypothetical protein|uniref:hypothetical protein n=1 Tax=Achromobacter marplatensis TaxID=470868 RepID=UPI003C710A84
MRIKKFFPFLDRAHDARAEGPVSFGALPAHAPVSPVYQFTIVSLSATLNTLRKQLYYELQALDLRVIAVRISRGESDQLASTVVTLHCPPHLRSLLSAVALRLGQSPDVRRVHWENETGASIAVLPA